VRASIHSVGLAAITIGGHRALQGNIPFPVPRASKADYAARSPRKIQPRLGQNRLSAIE